MALLSVAVIGGAIGFHYHAFRNRGFVPAPTSMEPSELERVLTGTRLTDAVREAVRGAAFSCIAVLGVAVEGADHLPFPADPAEQARELYASLREVDARGYALVIVPLPPPEGLGLAVADRLTARPREPSSHGGLFAGTDDEDEVATRRVHSGDVRRGAAGVARTPARTERAHRVAPRRHARSEAPRRVRTNALEVRVGVDGVQVGRA